MNDLTVVYYTLNKTPKGWQEFHIKHLIEAIGDCPIISVSRIPINFGTNLIDKEKPSYSNIYRQLLRSAKLAKTKYVATAEDDTLYSKEHYREFRPEDDEFSYNRSRWSVFAWEKDRAIYCLRNRVSNCSLIAPRELLIEALEERFEKYKGREIPERLMGECGRNKLEKMMHITLRKQVDWWSTCPVIQLNHDEGTEWKQGAHRKTHGQLKAIEIPYWGRASDIANEYKD